MKEIDAEAKDRVMNAEEKANWDQANSDLQVIIDAEQRATKLGTLANYMTESAKPEVVKAIQRASGSEEFGRAPESRIWNTQTPRRRGDYSDIEDKRASVTPEQKRRFREYLREGTIDGRSVRALQSDADTLGGFTVPLQVFQNEIIQAVHDIVYLWGRSRNFTVDRAESLGAPVLQTQFGLPNWATELSIGQQDNTMNFGKRELRPHPLAGSALVSKKLLRQSAIDVEALVRDQIAYKVAVRVEQALQNGMGNNQPLGIFSTDANNAISTGTDVIASSSGALSGSTDIGDNLIAMKYSLKQQYWPTGVFLTNRVFAQVIRQAKDVNGQYLWLPGGGYSAALASGSEPAFDSVLGRPLLMSEYAPLTTGTGANTTNQSPAVTGNSSGTPHTGYIGAFFDPNQIWTVQALSLSIQHVVELYAATNQDAFIYRMELDGQPVLGEAFSRLRAKGY